MSVSSSNGGRDRGSPPNLFAPIHGLAGQIRSGAPWRDMLSQLAVRAVKAPIRAGLIGGDYARYTAEHLPQTLQAIGAAMRGQGPNSQPPTMSVASARSAPPPAARPSTAPASTTAPQPVARESPATAAARAPRQAPGAGKAPSALPSLTPGGRHLLDAFSQAEGTDDAMARKRGFASGYDVPGGYRRMDRPLTSMTLDEVMEYQRLHGGPAGRYQAMRATLGDFKKAHGLTGQERFDPTLQDQFGAYALNRRGYGKSDLSPADMQLRMAKEWASIADPRTGLSYYTIKRNGVEERQPVKFRSPEFQAALARARQLDAPGR